MRLFRPHLVLAFSCSLLTSIAAGCGTQLSTLPATTKSYASVSGEWLFSNASATQSIAAGLVDQSGLVTGTATITGCSSTPEQTTLSGAVSDKGILTLNTAQLAQGATLKLSGQLSTDAKTVSNIIVTSSGNGCTLPFSQKIMGQVYAPATGSYAGTFTGSDGDATTVTATLSQNSTPGPGGSYTLSGSISFPASPCLATATINSASSVVTGGLLSAKYTSTVMGQSVTINATGTADTSANIINITNWNIVGGTCDGYSGTGTLSH